MMKIQLITSCFKSKHNNEFTGDFMQTTICEKKISHAYRNYCERCIPAHHFASKLLDFNDCVRIQEKKVIPLSM